MNPAGEQQRQTGQKAQKLESGKECGVFHRPTFPLLRRPSKERSIRRGAFQRGFALVEATIALSLLTVVGLILLQLSLNVIQPRQYALHQVLSDSYLTFERSMADRVPFETLTSDASPWPLFPAIQTATVEIGRLPGGRPVSATVTRTRFADAQNIPADGGVGTPATNPASMKIWKVQSVLRYEIAGRDYVKSRTFVRAQ